MRQNAHRDGAFRHLKAEARRTVPHVQTHAALQGGGDGGAQLAGRRQNTVGFAVVAVGDDVAGTEQFGDFVEVRRVVADVHHQRQIAVLALDGFRALQRRNAVFTDHAAAHARFQADDKIRVAFYCLLHGIGINIRHIGQFVLGNQPDAGDVQQGKHLGGGLAGNFIEIIHVICPGTAGIHHGGDARGNTYAVRLVVINRRVRVAVDVRVNPACADEHITVQLNRFTGGSVNVAQRSDFPVLNGDIGQGIVGEARAAQE